MVLTTAVNVKVLNDIQEEIRKYENGFMCALPLELRADKVGWHEMCHIHSKHLIEKLKKLNIQKGSRIVAILREGKRPGKDGKTYDYLKLETVEPFAEESVTSTVITTAINVRVNNNIQAEIEKYEAGQVPTVPLELKDDSEGWHKISRIYDKHLVDQIKRLKLHENSHVFATIAVGTFIAKDGKEYKYYKLKTVEIFDIVKQITQAVQPTQITQEKTEKEENGLFTCLNILNSNPFD